MRLSEFDREAIKELIRFKKELQEQKRKYPERFRKKGGKTQ